MSTRPIALLDDVAALAKVARRVAGRRRRPGWPGRGESGRVVIDDAAVTPRYVVGFAASRERPIVWRIALGSKNSWSSCCRRPWR